MRIFILLLLCSSVNAQIGRFSFSSANAASSGTGAESIWMFENTPTDQKGNRDLTATGGATYVLTPSPPQGAYSGDVNGSGRYFAIAQHDLGNYFTLIFEVYVGTGDGKTLYGALNANDGIRITLNVTGDDIVVTTGNGTDTEQARANNCGLSVNDFMMIACVFDRVVGTCTIYLDGSDVTDINTTRTDYETNTAANIGSRYSPGAYLYGYVDACQEYLWRLSAGNISTITATPGTEVFE